MKATAKRNPNYFVEGKPYFDNVEMLSIVDVTARTNALNTGEIHYMDRVDLKTIDLLKQNPNVDITNLTGFGHYVAPMDVRVPPFDNVDVRTRAQMGDQPQGIGRQDPAGLRHARQ